MMRVELPDWPGLLVVGKPVTPRQAAEVILRTTHLPLQSNNSARSAAVSRAMGGVKDSLQGDVYHFRNERIESCHAEGPHGWVDWDGTVGCFSYNIGKWPSVGAVEAELRILSAKFPYISMDVRLLQKEACEYEDGVTNVRDYLAQWRVSGGGVSRWAPEDLKPLEKKLLLRVREKQRQFTWEDPGISVASLRGTLKALGKLPLKRYQGVLMPADSAALLKAVGTTPRRIQCADSDELRLLVRNDYDTPALLDAIKEVRSQLGKP